MELEMLIVFSSVGLIVATVLWLALPWEPEPDKPAQSEIWVSIDHLIGPHREPANRSVSSRLLIDRDR